MTGIQTGATVEPFGSFVSDLFTRWGDLDVSIEFSNGSFVSPYGKKQKQRLLGDVMRAMRQKGSFVVFPFLNAYIIVFPGLPYIVEKIRKLNASVFSFVYD